MGKHSKVCMFKHFALNSLFSAPFGSLWVFTLRRIFTNRNCLTIWYRMNYKGWSSILRITFTIYSPWIWAQTSSDNSTSYSSNASAASLPRDMENLVPFGTVTKLQLSLCSSPGLRISGTFSFLCQGTSFQTISLTFLFSLPHRTFLYFKTRRGWIRTTDFLSCLPVIFQG